MEQTLIDFLPIAVLFGIALFFALLLPILSLSLGPKRLADRSLAPYESGMTAIGEAQRRRGRHARPQIQVFEQADAAAEFLLGEVRAGDTVLVKGSRAVGMERIVERLQQPAKPQEP